MLLLVWLWKMPIHVLIFGFLGVKPLKIVGCHQKPQKAHAWARTHHLSHKRSKSVQGFDLGAIAKKI